MSRGQAIKLKVYKEVIGLVKDNRKPTSQAVINKIGGSYSTICPIISELKKQTHKFSDLEPIFKFIKEHGGMDDLLIDSSSLIVKQQSEMLEKLEADNLNLLRQVVKMEALEAECKRLKELNEYVQLERETFAAQTLKMRSAELTDIMSEFKETNLEYAKQQLNAGFEQDEALLKKDLEIDALKIELENAKEQVKLAELKAQDKVKQSVSTNEIVISLKKANQRLREENSRLVSETYKDN